MEYRLFDPSSPPGWLDPTWWRDTDSCNHLGHPAGVHTARLKAVADLVVSVYDSAMFRREGRPWITDVGAGDGALLSLLPERVRRQAVGYEIIRDSVRYAVEVRGVDVREANVQTDALEWGGPSSLAVCTEMLEHLADPHRFVRETLAGVDWLIASSPRFETDTHHEWNHAWAWDHDGYAALLEQGGFEVVQHRDVEWSQIILARSVVSQAKSDALAA